jgi:hypothetical protein
MKRTLLMLAALLLVSPAVWAHNGLRSVPMSEVAALAHSVERSARHVHRAAEARSHHLTSAESVALARLHALERAARHFHRQTERFHRHPVHTAHDYRRLVTAYYRAADGFRTLHADRHVRADWRQVQIDMNRLMFLYGDRRSVAFRLRPHRWGHGHYSGPVHDRHIRIPR